MNLWLFLVWCVAAMLVPNHAFPAAAVFSGSDVKILKDNLDLNGKGKILSGTTDPTSSNVSAPIGALYINTSNGNLYRKLDAGSSTNWVQVGSGASGKNYITNTGAEANVTGATAFADAAGTSPVDGTGGSPTLTITRTTSSPLTGVGSYLITKDASNRQGEGVSWAFSMDRSDFAKPLRVSFNYELGSGTFVSGDSSDLRVWVYDVTNSALIQVAPYTIQAGTVAGQHRFIGTFQTSATGTSYRLIVHQATTSSAAYTFKLDDIYVGPDAQSYGAPISDWNTFTPTGTWSSNTTHTGRWRRVGDTMQVETLAVTSGAPTASQFRLNLPTGFQIDTTKLPGSGRGFGPEPVLGSAKVLDGSTKIYIGSVIYYDATSVIVYAAEGAGATDNAVSQVNPMTFGADDSVSLNYTVPIVGWSSNVLMSSDTDTRVVAARAYSSANQTISTGSITKLNLDTTTFDTHGAFNTSTRRYTAVVPGYYDVSLVVQFAAGATGQRVGYIYKNGSDFAQMNGSGNASAGAASVSTIVPMVAGDYLEFHAFQDSGGSLDVAGGPPSTFVSIRRLAGPSAIAATETVSAKYTAASGAATPNTGTVFDYDTKVWDTHNAVTTGSGWKFTAPVSGRYAVSASLAINSTAIQGYTITVYHNTTAKENGYAVRPATVNYNLNANVSTVLRLLAGDYIQVKHSADVVTGTFMVAGPELQFITIDRVGNY